jgi:hypothetical protein
MTDEIERLHEIIAELTERVTALEAMNGGKGGWISWNGGVCPVDEGVKVDVLLRNGGGIFTGTYWEWGHYGGDGDIIAYRVAE